MRISTEQLIKLPVETVSGTELGKVHAVVFDIDFQSIVHYVVRSKGLVEEFIHREERLIAPSQVRSISLQKMIVEDAVLTEKEARAVRAGVRGQGVV